MCEMASGESWQPEQDATVGDITRVVAAASVVVPVVALNENPLP
jgi:hypothetical protein